MKRLLVAAALMTGCGGAATPDAAAIDSLAVDSMPVDATVDLHVPDAANGCPDGMTRIAAFCVDRYEAYVVELDAQGDERPHSPYAGVDGLTVRARVAPGVVPQGYISQVQAAAACAHAGKRL